MVMDDGELDFSNHEMFLGSNAGDNPSSDSMNSFFDEIFNDTHACTHTHKCNPPGPDSSHTHTCYHVHTKILPNTSDDENNTTTAESLTKKSKKKPPGNREAVRKYREKKKARAALLENEVVRLRALNQQLMKRVQSQVGLEAEVGRLKCLLIDIRGRIDGEIGSFPYQKQHPAYHSVDQNLAGELLLNPCNVQRGASLHHDLDVNGCETDGMQCLGSMLGELPVCGANNGLVVVNPSGTKSKGKQALLFMLLLLLLLFVFMKPLKVNSRDPANTSLLIGSSKTQFALDRWLSRCLKAEYQWNASVIAFYWLCVLNF